MAKTDCVSHDIIGIRIHRNGIGSVLPVFRQFQGKIHQKYIHGRFFKRDGLKGEDLLIIGSHKSTTVRGQGCGELISI